MTPPPTTKLITFRSPYHWGDLAIALNVGITLGQLPRSMTPDAKDVWQLVRSWPAEEDFAAAAGAYEVRVAASSLRDVANAGEVLVRVAFALAAYTTMLAEGQVCLAFGLEFLRLVTGPTEAAEADEEARK